MKLIKTIAELQAWSKQAKANGATVGLVPTMGFLHAGHLSLIDAARANGATAVIVSIFVNPTQFGPHEDLDKYPRDFEHDTMLCREKNVDVIFCPEVSDMYHAPLTCWVQEEEISQGLCGRSRPIHFRGVATVVTKLFNAALPDLAVFGQKDAQQAAVIKRMVRDLNFPIQIVIAPLVREKDGLALSSRNKYLNTNERSGALSISRSLFEVKRRYESGEERNPARLIEFIAGELRNAGGKIDYVECLNADTMQSFETLPESLIFAVAVSFGATRLIDNLVISSR